MALRDYSGNAVETTITADINPTDLSISIGDATGWPSGGAAGKFFVTLNRGGSTEERVLVASRTGTALTVAATGDRGVDNTIAAAHGAGTSISHGITATDADEANSHINDSTRDDHGQYLNTGRHDVEARHSFGLALGTPGPAADVGTAAATGTGDDPAREDHVHKLGAGSINGAGLFGAGVVETAAIANAAITLAKMALLSVGTGQLVDDAVTQAKMGLLSVGTPELIDDSVTAAKLGDGAVDAVDKFSNNLIPVFSQAADPGAVGADKIWFDTTTRRIKVRNAADSAWVTYAEPVLLWANYTPVFTNVVLGTGGTTYGRRYRIGDTCIAELGFTLGTGGNVTGTIIGSLPFTAATVTRSDAAANRFTWLSAGWAVQAGGAVFASVGAIDTTASLTTVRAFATAGASASWDANTPFNWDSSDHFHCLIVYEVDD